MDNKLRRGVFMWSDDRCVLPGEAYAIEAGKLLNIQKDQINGHSGDNHIWTK
jgi:hypothetical protein